MTGMSLLKEAKTWHYYRDNIILADHPGEIKQDAVFPVCHENIYFVDNFIIPKDSIVLDLCTGSGIIAIFAAEKAKKVVAVDINQRAIEFAKFNAGLNGFIDKIDFRIGNLFDPVKDMKFNVITVNPPFEPTPANYKNFLHSDGGEDGTLVLQEIIKEVHKYLLPNGSLQMIFYLREDKLNVLSILNQVFMEVKIKELGSFSPGTYNNYLKTRLDILNSGAQLTSPGKFSVKYLFLKADGLK